MFVIVSPMATWLRARMMSSCCMSDWVLARTSTMRSMRSRRVGSLLPFVSCSIEFPAPLMSLPFLPPQVGDHQSNLLKSNADRKRFLEWLQPLQAEPRAGFLDLGALLLV